MNEFAATTDGFTGDNPGDGSLTLAGWGCDSGLLAQWKAPGSKVLQHVPSCVPDYSLNPVRYPYGGAFEATPVAHVPTIMDEMDAASPPVTWNIYGATPGGSGYSWAGCPTFAACLDTSQGKHLVDNSKFFTDAAAGKLPSVSFVMPHVGESQHNGQHNSAGDNWIGKVASAVMSSPDWPSTALIITWDDCGCFYDHVPPPLAPDGRQEGPRVPFIVVSPYAKPAHTDSTTTSSTGSILAFIESTFGLAPLTANDANAYNLSGMFSLTSAPRLVHPRMKWRKLPPSYYRVNPAAARDGT